MKNIITLILALFLFGTAFSQERLIKVINDGDGPQAWQTITTDRYTYLPQGQIKTSQHNAYDTTGINIYLSSLRRYYYNNIGLIDSMAQLRIIPQTGDTSLSYYAKYFYTNLLLDSLVGINVYNGIITEAAATKYIYQNGLKTSYLQYSYDSNYGYYLSHKQNYFYDLNENCTSEIYTWGFLDQDLNYSYTDTLYVKLEHYYSNTSRRDSTIELATEMNSISDIVELTPRHKTLYKYTQADSLARKEFYEYEFDIDFPQHYYWALPRIENYLYNIDNFVEKWNLYNLSDSLLGSLATCAQYYRSANNRLDSIYSGHSLSPGGFDLDMISDFGLARTIYIYSNDEGEINTVNNLQAFNLTIYPNPTAQFITIETDNFDTKQILIFDMMGKVVDNQITLDKKYIYDIRELPAGMYMVSVATSKGSVIKTVIKAQ